MFSKISAFIFSGFIFLAFPFIALASNGSFTASNYSYDPSSHELQFDISDLTVSIDTSSMYVQLYDDSQNVQHDVGETDFRQPGFNCTSNHCDVILNYQLETPFYPSDTFHITLSDTVPNGAIS